MRHLLLIAAVAAACGEPAGPTVVFVTVQARPAVGEAAALAVTLRNDSASVSDQLDLGGLGFPVTFTVTPENRAGALEVDVVALASDGRALGQGTATATIAPEDRIDLELLLEPGDFVVNTEVAGDQRLTFTPSRNGRQLAADDGRFLVTFVNDCAMLGRCDVFARLHDAEGRPLVNGVSMDDGELIANRSNEFTAGPSAVFGTSSLMIVWESASDIRAVAFEDDATPLGTVDTIVSSLPEALPEAPHVAALADGRFLVVWRELEPAPGVGALIKGRMLGPDAQPAVNAITGDTGDFQINTTTDGVARTPFVAAGPDGAVIAWRDGPAIHARFLDTGGGLVPSAQVELASYPSGALLSGPVATWADGVAHVVWTVRTASDPRLEAGGVVMRRFTTPIGQPAGPAVIVSSAAGDALTSPSVAIGAQDTRAVAWHACGEDGDQQGCAVRLQLHRATGQPIGAPIIVNTTRAGDQLGPSLAPVGDAFAIAWSDESQVAPDTSGAAVRARLVYPVLDPSDGRLGARCGRADDTPCAEGLVCMGGSDELPLCRRACDPAGPAPQCPDGGICTTAGSESACLF